MRQHPFIKSVTWTPASPTIEDAREALAKRAEQDGEVTFAREVRAGCWDHRSDPQAVLAGRKLRP